MSDEKDDKKSVDSLLKSMFGSMKKQPLSPIGEKEIIAKFGANINTEKVSEEIIETSSAENAPATPEAIAKSARDKIFPSEVPVEFREDFVTLSTAVSILLGGFVCINTAHTPGLPEDKRDALYTTAQGLCNRGAEILKNLKTVQFSISKPDMEGNLTIQTIHERKVK